MTGPGGAGIAAVPIGNLGNIPSTHKPRWLAFFYAVSALGALLFAMPQFMTSKYSPLGGVVGVPLCNINAGATPG